MKVYILNVRITISKLEHFPIHISPSNVFMRFWSSQYVVAEFHYYIENAREEFKTHNFQYFSN